MCPTSTEFEPGTFSQQSVKRYRSCSIRTDGQDQTASHSSQCCEGAQTFEYPVRKTGEDREERDTLRVVPSLRQTTVALTTSCPSRFVKVAFSASSRSQIQRSGLPGIRTGILATTLCPSSLCSRYMITFANHNNFRRVDTGQRGLGTNTAKRWRLQRHHPSDFFPRPQYKHCCARATYYRIIILPNNYRLVCHSPPLFRGTCGQSDKWAMFT